MKGPNDFQRRDFLGLAAAMFAGAGMANGSWPRYAWNPKRSTGVTPHFDQLKKIDAGLLNVSYAESGPASGPAVLLLHGWPYDINSFAEVAPILAAKGYRVIIPFLRGYGGTRFLSNETR